MHLFKFIRNFLRQFRLKKLPIKPSTPNLSETRQENASPTRQVKEPQKDPKILSQGEESSSGPSIDRCPYCSKVLTGHIDILQLRNGAVHILDYKPQDKDKRRLKPVTQLTLYALMLSRLTGLRLYDFKCAWFDENSYFEFFPLHVVYKLRERVKKEHPDQMKMFEERGGVNAIQADL